MALTTPTLLSQVAFDATQPQTFAFTVQGSSAQVVANQLTIRNQDTNDIVYQEKQETFTYTHIVNANELTNGTYYNATISTFDNDGNQSAESVPIQFWCYTTPIISFTNLPTSNIITNASFNFEFTYTQNENEPLNSYIINLYNSFQTLISTSGVQYTNSTTVPFNGSYLFSGFDNATTYYIQIVGTTLEGTVINTVMQQITVQYIQPDTFTLVQLTNNCDEGYITVQSNIILIEGTSNPDPPTYINNQEVDLTDNGSWVQWNEGFNITGNILTRVWFRNPNNYTTLVQFSNTNGQTIKLKFMLGYENVNTDNLQAYIEAYVESVNGFPYYIYSNYVTPLDSTEGYIIYFTKVNNVYNLQLLTE